jgi:DNA-binding GntR family transcriptional regulator
LQFYYSEIVPVVVKGDLARVLHVPAGSALISFQETGYNDENEPIVMAYSYFRDDLLRLRIMRRQVL